MTLYINGKASTLPDGTNVNQLIQQMDLAGKRIAIELNQEIISRSTYTEQILQNDDRIEIVNAIGGG